MNPEKIDKYLYIKNTPTWIVRLLYVFGMVSWGLVLYGFRGAIVMDPFFSWVVAPILGFLTIYHFLSFGINLFYKQFDLGAHISRVKKYWSEYNPKPSIDVFLPICGEDLSVLANTWKHVSKIRYKNRKVFVLDDSKEECDEHKALAERYGFTYVARPNKGEMKKAGNLKYTYLRTSGDFIVIFDADFAPHQDFLHELLPYTVDPCVGIVQSPQYFEATSCSYKNSPLAYAAAYQEEVFYRVMQVAKDRLNSAICCGSNAVYRRSALVAIGGPRQVDASEDSRTGFAMLNKGYITRYVPILVAIGLCPDNTYAYFHQQHRWCRGRSELVLSKEFASSRVSLTAKICNLSGFLSFLSQPLEILLSFQLFWTLFFYNEYISFGNSSIFYPYIIFSLILFPLFHITYLKKEAFIAALIRAYASTHALFGVFFGKTVAWIPTNAKHTKISPAFRQATLMLSIYLSVYISLSILGACAGLFHVFQLNYYSVQFWIFWNLILPGALLLQMYRVLASAQTRQLKIEGGPHFSSLPWHFKMVGSYVAGIALLTMSLIMCILYL